MSAQFKFGIVVDNAPLPALSREWEEYRGMYKKDRRPTPITSHFLGPGKTVQGACGINT